MLTKSSLVRSLMFEAFKYYKKPNFSVEMQMFPHSWMIKPKTTV